MSLPKYHVAVIGCGPMGVTNIDEYLPFEYSAVGAILKHPQTELTALVDIDEEKANFYAKRFDVPPFYNFREMLDQANPDIVWCTGGPEINRKIVEESTLRGLKGVICEKPLVLSLEEADKLSDLEKKSKTKFQVNYYRNYDPWHIAIGDFIREGGIGNLQLVRLLYNGGIKAVFPHATAYLLGNIFEKPFSVSGIYSPLKNISTDDDPNIDGSIRFLFTPQGREVTALVAATGRGKEEGNTYLFEMEFTGSKGRISILNCGWAIRYEEMRHCVVFPTLESKFPFEINYLPLKILKHQPPRDPFINGLTDLIEAIEKDEPTRFGISRARDTEEVSHALALSAKSQGLAVNFPLTGEQRKHEFKQALAGINLLKQQEGERIPPLEEV